MKVGILTLPLHYNYGGILQAFALYKVLEEMQHRPVLIRRDRKKTLVNRLGSYCSWLLYHSLGIDKGVKWAKANTILCQNTSSFVAAYIPNQSEVVYSGKQLRRLLNDEHFDAVVVGSDQVWRRHYVPNIYNYFLDFCKDRGKTCKVAYGASFGDEKWQYSDSETKELRRLISEFNAVSVREDAGIKLCKDYLGINAKLVLDPAFLIERDVYDDICTKARMTIPSNTLACYLLDRTAEKESFVYKVAKEKDLEPYLLSPKYTLSWENYYHHFQDCIWGAVVEWLYAISHAAFIVTDSYHGCVFSIIFHRNFFVVENKSRGFSRIQSLLGLLGLKDHMISLSSNNLSHLNIVTDWNDVDARLMKEKLGSRLFLKDSLQNF